MKPSMGITYAEIELVRGADLALFREGYISESQIRKVKVLASVNRDASMLMVPESLKQLLDLRKVDEMQAELADGSVVSLAVVGPIEVRFQNRRTTVNAMVLPDDSEVSLGAIPLNGLDVIVEPLRSQLVVNSKSPDMARMLLK